MNIVGLYLCCKGWMSRWHISYEITNNIGKWTLMFNPNKNMFAGISRDYRKEKILLPKCCKTYNYHDNYKPYLWITK